MILKRIISVLIILILSLLLLGMTALACFFIFIPPYLESQLIPDIAQKAGIELTSIQVRSIGIRGAELSDIRIGGDESEGLFIDSVRVDYSIRQLLEYNVRQITVSGISADIEYMDGDISIKGLEGIFESKGDDKTDDSDMTFSIEKVYVRNSQATLHMNEMVFHLPFDLYAGMITQDLMPRELSANIYPEGHRVNIKGVPDPADNAMRITLLTNNLPLSKYLHITDNFLPLDLRGLVDLNVSAMLDSESFAVSDISVSCILNRTKINLGDIVIRNPAANGNEDLPVKIHLVSKDATQWEFNISEIMAVTPLSSVVMSASGDISINNKNIKANSKILTSQPVNAGQTATETVPGSEDILTFPCLEWDITAEQDEDENVNIQVSGRACQENSSNQARLVIQDLILTSGSPEIRITGSFEDSLFTVSYNVTIPDIKINDDDMRLSIPSIRLAGDISNSPDSSSVRSSFSLKIPGTKFTGYDISADIPDAEVKGSVQYESTEGIKTESLLSFKQGSLSLSEGMVKVRGLSGTVPVKWPFEDNASGSVAIKSAEYEGMELGRLETEIQQKKDRVLLSGNYYSALLKDMVFDISGDISLDPIFEKAGIEINLPDFRPSSDIDLARFLPDLKNMYLNGLFNLSCNLSYSGTGLGSACIIKVDNAGFRDSENKLAIEGISTSLELTDLLELKSAPGQILKVNKISSGNINASDLILDFQIESTESLLVEKGRFKWCGGNVNMQSFRFLPEKDEYDLALFCDRLNLAEVLGQFGAANATGEGAVNGRIPLRISKGHLTFEDGFLYSTPGGGGQISIGNTGFLTAGLTPGSREREQIEIAVEALKDFEYAWVKMGLNSVEDDLMINLQFDGKPANKLPFWYDSNEGRFVRVDKSLEGSTFQGFRLDINFQVPLDKLLNYKGVWDMIQ